MLPLKFLDPRSLSEQLDKVSKGVSKGVFSIGKKASNIPTSPLTLSSSASKTTTNQITRDASSTGPEALNAFARDRRRYSSRDRLASQMVEKPPTGTNAEGSRDRPQLKKIEDFEVRTPVEDALKKK